MKKYILILFFLMAIARLNGQVSVLGELSRTSTASPGETYQGTIEVVNGGKLEEAVKAYQTDYRCDADGHNEYGDPGLLPRSNAKWIEFSPRQLRVPAGEKGIINYIVHVPRIDSLAGSYWSMFMIEPDAKIDPKAFKGQFGIFTVLRYGIQMITNINDTGTKGFQFSNVKLAKDSTGYLIWFDSANTGQRWLKASIWAELWDKDGKHIGKFEGNELHPLPGNSSRQAVRITNIQPGRYKALLVADCGGEDVYGMNLNLEITP
jgi:peptidoglycan hydrolase-like protein with peptidoglycan-binding domain